MWMDLFYGGPKPLLHTFVVAVLAYPAMLVMLRLSGHRTLSKLNAFDLIVTVALGSTLASAITSRDVSLLQGLLAFALLILMQYGMTKLAERSNRIESVVNGEPVLLFHRGRFLANAMERERLTENELLAAARGEGKSGLDEVESIVLETNGQLSVVAARAAAGREAPRAETQKSTLHPVAAG